jgi:hypothetical protein
MKRVYAQPPPDEFFDWCPERYTVTWIEADPEHERVISQDEAHRKCRRLGCQWPVAWALLRSDSRRTAGVWWFYCAEHNYGRRIEGGKVLRRRWDPIA